MSCTNPLYRIPLFSLNFKLLSLVDQNKLKNRGVIINSKTLSHYETLENWSSDPSNVQMLPCGQCISCRLKYAKEWAVRCSLEAQLHENNYFITLTYDDLHLPKGEFIDYKGDIYNSNLCRRDIQLFIKSYREYERKNFNNIGIKVFYCGEYGELTSRPHYHVCLFGCSVLHDLVYKFTKGRYKYYSSEILNNCWVSSETSFPRGNVFVSECSFDSIAYTARYCLKKIGGKIKNDFYDYYDQLDPVNRPAIRSNTFVGMSRRPGIAFQYYEDNKHQIYLEDKVKYSKRYELFSSKPPRYFDKLFDLEDHLAFERVLKKRRKSLLSSLVFKARLTSDSREARLLREADIIERKVSKYYVRDLP